MTTIFLLVIIVIMAAMLYKTGVYSNFVFWIAGVLATVGAFWEKISGVVAGWLG